MHDPNALFNIINQQRRDRAVIEANDVSRRKPATRRDGRKVAAVKTKQQDTTAAKREGSQSATTSKVKREGNHRYENNERFV